MAINLFARMKATPPTRIPLELRISLAANLHLRFHITSRLLGLGRKIRLPRVLAGYPYSSPAGSATPRQVTMSSRLISGLPTGRQVIARCANHMSLQTITGIPRVLAPG